jgi:hypothetical protein
LYANIFNQTCGIVLRAARPILDHSPSFITFIAVRCHSKNGNSGHVAMNYTIDWDNDDHTCILITHGPALTWEIARAAFDEMVAMMQTVDQTVDVISNISLSLNMPKENATTHVRVMLNQLPANTGMLVVITPPYSLFTITLLNSIFRIIAWNRGFAMATSLADAREMIQEHRSRIVA